MTTDLDHGKKIPSDNAPHEPGAGDALQKPGWRYYMEDFLYPAKYVTESTVEEAEMKDELVTQIANRLAKILNRSGLRKRFALSENFNDMLRFDEINDIEGVMFASEDDTAFIRVKMTEEQGGAINFALMICDNTDDGLRVFNGTGWEDALRSPESILEAPGAKNEKYAKSLQGFADAVKKAKKAVH